MNTVRLRYLLRPREVTDRTSLQVLSVYRDYGVIPKDSRSDNFNKTPEDITRYQEVRVGDLVVNKMKAWQGSVGISSYHGIVSPDYLVCSVDSSVDSPFMHHLLRSAPLAAEFGARSKGIRPAQWRLYWEDLAEITITLPALDDQRRIADFLDHETARIDALISAKRRMVGLLEERWRIERDELVTGRVERTSGKLFSTRKSSGVDWLPTMPTAWRRYPLKHFFSFSKGKDAQRLTQEYVADHAGTYPVYSGQTAQAGVFGTIDSFDFNLPNGGIIVSTVGAEAMTPRLVWGPFSLSQNCAVLIPRNSTSLDLRFMRFQLDPLFAFKRAEIPDHMQPSLRIEDLSGYRVIAPSVAEQRSIGDHLQSSRGRLDIIRLSLEAQLTLLSERRQALITAAVTGKLDIPEAA